MNNSQGFSFAFNMDIDHLADVLLHLKGEVLLEKQLQLQGWLPSQVGSPA